MCGIYGVLSYKDKLKDMNELVDLLGMESAERGTDRKSTRLNSSHTQKSRMPSSA